MKASEVLHQLLGCYHDATMDAPVVLRGRDYSYAITGVTLQGGQITFHVDEELNEHPELCDRIGELELDLLRLRRKAG